MLAKTCRDLPTSPELADNRSGFYVTAGLSYADTPFMLLQQCEVLRMAGARTADSGSCCRLVASVSRIDS